MTFSCWHSRYTMVSNTQDKAVLTTGRYEYTTQSAPFIFDPSTTPATGCCSVSSPCNKAAMLWWGIKGMLCSTRWTLDEQKWVYLSTTRKFRWLQCLLTNNQEITSTNPDSEMAILNKTANTTRIFPLRVSTVTWTTTASSHILLNSYIINYVHKVSNLYQWYLNWLIRYILK